MTAPKEQTSYFSPEGYKQIIDAARARGYSISGFREFDSSSPRALILRHDVDHSLRSAGLVGDLEASLAVRSTYFVQVAAPFYNLVSEESRAILRRLTAQGHEIGLHYDSRRYLGDDGERQLLRDKALLEDLIDQEIVSASQHIPIDTPELPIPQFFQFDAYDRRFTEGEFRYISDSLMAWRQAHPLEAIEQGYSFQLLTHPFAWAHPTASLEAALDRALTEETARLEESYRVVRNYYRGLLENRRDLDALFVARRSGGDSQ